MEQNLATEKLTLGNKIKFFFTKPTELFKQFIEKPGFGMQFIILGIITTIYSVVYSITSKDLMDKVINEQIKDLTPQAIEMTKNIVNFMKSPIVMVIGALISLYIGLLVVSLIYWGVIKLFKGKISYMQTVAVYSLAAIATGVGQILKSLYMLIASKPIGTEQALNPSYSGLIFSSIDVFTIWYVVLLIFGISTVSGLSKKKSTIIVIVIMALNIGYKLLQLSKALALKGGM